MADGKARGGKEQGEEKGEQGPSCYSPLGSLGVPSPPDLVPTHAYSCLEPLKYFPKSLISLLSISIHFLSNNKSYKGLVSRVHKGLLHKSINTTSLQIIDISPKKIHSGP